MYGTPNNVPDWGFSAILRSIQAEVKPFVHHLFRRRISSRREAPLREDSLLTGAKRPFAWSAGPSVPLDSKNVVLVNGANEGSKDEYSESFSGEKGRTLAPLAFGEPLTSFADSHNVIIGS
ncbi:hypothetical protein Harman_18210 [Haloarcula mannanilytica]|uniref:Uncharacterized protein n=1 Tax=Haloarcula mannanilytica TaxID=2509225 RepID=A0A4C2EHI8_9EURY|nr:hypothetical protein Harman_18210 [Haloarcula mannanilytica]